MNNTESEKNVTTIFGKLESCQYQQAHLVVLSLNDIITSLIGQPVMARLLWITFNSKKTLDILNCNLALFHNMQYLVSTLHLFALFLLPQNSRIILKFLFVYAGIGGPVCLNFICLERYVAVIYPTFYPLLKKYRFREAGAVTVWLFSVPTALASVLAPDIPSFSQVPSGMMIGMTTMMVMCNLSIAKALKKSSLGKDLLHPSKRRALKTIRATSCITLLCYIPVAYLQWFRGSCSPA
ncbi:hypothetical protein ABVT39_019980 [Epinephelus coioides]